MKKIFNCLIIVLLLFITSACQKVEKSSEKDYIAETTDVGLPTTPSADPTCDCDVTPIPTLTPTPTPTLTKGPMDLVYVETINADDNEDCARGQFNIRAKELGYDTIQYPDTSQYYIYTNPSAGSIKLGIKLGSSDSKLAKQVDKIKFTLKSDIMYNDFQIRKLDGSIDSFKAGSDSYYILDWVTDEDHPDTSAIWLMNIWDNNDPSRQKIFWICDFKLKGHNKWQSEEWFDNGYDSYGPSRNDMFYLFNIYNDFDWQTIDYTKERFSWKIKTDERYIKELNVFVSSGCIVDLKVYHDEKEIYTLYDNPKFVDFKIEFIYQFDDEYYLWKFNPEKIVIPIEYYTSTYDSEFLDFYHGCIYYDFPVKYEELQYMVDIYNLFDNLDGQRFIDICYNIYVNMYRYADDGQTIAYE